MTETWTVVGGVLTGLITAGSIAYAKIRSINHAHAEKMVELENNKHIAIAEANARADDAEDKRQNEAFDRLKQSFDTLQQMFNDLLTRTQKLENDHKTLKAEHAHCQQVTDQLQKEIAGLKKG